MSLIHLPVWTTANTAITLLQASGTLGGLGEVSGDNAGYSKFAHADKKFKVASRPAMLTLYAPSYVVGMYAMMVAYLSTTGNGREFFFASLVAFHYGKRCLECVRVHKYSGTMDGDVMCGISFFYTLTTIILTYQQAHVVAYDHPLDSVMLYAGTVLFFVGQLGNLYHHVILANLRSQPGEGGADKKYVIPTAGFFKYVTMPHYFFEVVAWFGLACVGQQLNCFLTVAGMISYLSGRSFATTKWYKTKFPDYPPERKHLIPFLF